MHSRGQPEPAERVDFDPNKVIEEPPTDIQAIEDEFTAWQKSAVPLSKTP